jgi:hypothetical protein
VSLNPSGEIAYSPGGNCGSLGLSVQVIKFDGLCSASFCQPVNDCKFKITVQYQTSSACTCNDFIATECGTPLYPAPACQAACTTPCTIHTTEITRQCNSTCAIDYTIQDSGEPANAAGVSGTLTCAPCL